MLSYFIKYLKNKIKYGIIEINMADGHKVIICFLCS